VAIDDKYGDDDATEITTTTGVEVEIDPTREIAAVMDDLDALLKNGDVIDALTKKGINSSLALIALAGLRSYLEGDKVAAADDLGTAAEEILGRAAMSKSQGSPS
jgi:hypothetical protein